MTDKPPIADAGTASEMTGGIPPMDLANSRIRYVNFCRVTGTPEEMIIDLGLQTAEGAQGGVWKTPQQITLNFLTAKRLVLTLEATMQRFEATVGVVETNIETRLKGPVR